MFNEMLKKLANKKGEGEGKTSYDLIGLILVIIIIAIVSVPIANTIKAGGVTANKNYKNVYNAIMDSANNDSDVTISLDKISTGERESD